jgi:helix-turn-helix protein
VRLPVFNNFRLFPEEGRFLSSASLAIAAARRRVAMLPARSTASLAAERLSYGSRRITAELRIQGWRVNRKQVKWIMR